MSFISKVRIDAEFSRLMNSTVEAFLRKRIFYQGGGWRKLWTQLMYKINIWSVWSTCRLANRKVVENKTRLRTVMYIELTNINITIFSDELNVTIFAVPSRWQSQPASLGNLFYDSIGFEKTFGSKLGLGRIPSNLLNGWESVLASRWKK